MSNTSTKDKISILKAEYYRLKKLDERFRDFWLYLENLIDIREARKEVKQKKIIPQEKLFKQLGF
jgi:plasmid maintenance system antidote protein VapI